MANEIKTKGTENVPNFEEFFDKMDMHFNPAYPKSGALEGGSKEVLPGSKGIPKAL